MQELLNISVTIFFYINWKSCPTPGGSNQSTGYLDKVEMIITTEVPDSIQTRLTIESSIVGHLNFTQETDGKDSRWIISLNGQSHENEDRITAYYTKDDGTKVAVGHLNMVSYSKQNMKVVVVPVNENYAPSAQEIKAYLDNTYKTAITF